MGGRGSAEAAVLQAKERRSAVEAEKRELASPDFAFALGRRRLLR